MIKILVVDDSATARLALRRSIEMEADLRVVAEAVNGREALRKVESVKPDLVTMDVFLGSEDGVQLAGTIMQTCPVPIIIVTGVNSQDPGLAFRAVQAGALEVTGKLPAPNDASYEPERRRLVRMIRALADVPTVTRRASTSRASSNRDIDTRARKRSTLDAPCKLVVVAASTGGPQVLQGILTSLPKSFNVPVAIVQHVADGFGSAMAEWLTDTTGHNTVVCKGRRALEPGMVFLAPDDEHLCMVSHTMISSVSGPPRRFQRPSADEFFESVARFYGPEVVAVQLTGMGQDGVEGLRALKEAGALVVAQAPQTCVVASMPAMAIEQGIVDQVGTPEEIGSILQRSAQPR